MIEQKIYSTAKELLKRAVCDLPRDVELALASARKAEQSETAKAQLDAVLENIGIARKEGVPMCQDTGLPVFYVSVGDESMAKAKDIKGAITKAVADATREIPLRPNVVHPLTRKNTGNNTGLGFPQIEFDFVSGKGIEITAKPVGCGCETFSRLEMLKPATGEDEIVECVAEFAKTAGGRPCPPYVLGIAIGGTADIAMREAKQQTLRTISSAKESAIEKRLLGAVNATGIGPMGLGGSTTALAVHACVLGTHTAMLPLAINTCCWACRRASAKIKGDKVEYL